MTETTLTKPGPQHRAAFVDMMTEWEADGGRIYPGSLRHWRGADGGDGGDHYDRWLARLAADAAWETCGPGRVPQDLYVLCDDAGRLYGAIAVRHALNDELWRTGGHIGYGVRPSERRRGYASRMLALALAKLRALGIERALIACNKDNIASARTILRGGGAYEDEVAEDSGNLVQRYWIDL